LWCDEELSKFVDQRKKTTKLQWLQDPSHINVQNGKRYDVKTANSKQQTANSKHCYNKKEGIFERNIYQL
jgi:hypothetical protein